MRPEVDGALLPACVPDESTAVAAGMADDSALRGGRCGGRRKGTVHVASPALLLPTYDVSAAKAATKRIADAAEMRRLIETRSEPHHDATPGPHRQGSFVARLGKRMSRERGSSSEGKRLSRERAPDSETGGSHAPAHATGLEVLSAFT